MARIARTHWKSRICTPYVCQVWMGAGIAGRQVIEVRSNRQGPPFRPDEVGTPKRSHRNARKGHLSLWGAFPEMECPLPPATPSGAAGAAGAAEGEKCGAAGTTEQLCTGIYSAFFMVFGRADTDLFLLDVFTFVLGSAGGRVLVFGVQPPADRMPLVPWGGGSRSGAKGTNVPFVDSDGFPKLNVFPSQPSSCPAKFVLPCWRRAPEPRCGQLTVSAWADCQSGRYTLQGNPHGIGGHLSGTTLHPLCMVHSTPLAHAWANTG
eukprot:gene7343-biopygen12044